ncbi:hypothetical protein [Jatrophihabitans sp.]|uniref:hypothetical protein n=1 Tax=Jatrophihabitans sp. TaxID=1932789 RepID=UPI0030C6FB87|nr:hypothetical protein [Jatrophihabitans sp.]
MTTIEKPTGGAVVKPRGRSKLDQLAGLYDAVKAEKDEAEKKLKAITDAIKVELTEAAPGETSIDLVSESLAKPLRLMAVTSYRIDSTKLKEEHPEIYTAYAKPSTAWTLRQVSA